MEDEIEVGEYVKTHNGDIHKVIGIREEVKEGKRIYSHKAYYLDSKKGSLTEAFIIKHSKNIKDLIEEGDYVNGYRVVDIMEDMKTGELHLEMTSDYTNPEIGDCTIYNKDIKTIVTHEQFAQNEYKVKD